MKNPIIMMLNNSLNMLPTPTSLSYKWNYGFMLSMCLIMQIMTGLILTMHYTPNIYFSFQSVVEICMNMEAGWWMRFIHANGASLFFFLIYMHVGRGIYYKSFFFTEVWSIGTLILMVSMMTAFFGYVLPWGQMSFWGATVITNLLSVIPYLGKFLVEWVWGGFSVSNPTLNRFYTFHFILPFVILMLVILHLFFLHETGSSNPGGLNSNLDKMMFYPYFLMKDLLFFLWLLLLLTVIIIQYPTILGDPENFIIANPLVTPIHIQPEWYLLFAYSILRAIPNKLGGIVALAMSLLSLFFLPFMSQKKIIPSLFMFIFKVNFWNFVFLIFILTWLGSCPVENPYILAGQVSTCLYFLSFPLLSWILKIYFKMF